MKTLLILVAIIGIAAVLGAIVVGNSTFDGTVVDNPYESGLAYDAVQKEREGSGWIVAIVNPSGHVGKNDLMISVTDKDGRHVSATDVTLTISRPSSTVYDKTYTTIRTDAGLFRAEITLPLHGYWDAKIHITAEGKSITFERKFLAEQDKK